MSDDKTRVGKRNSMHRIPSVDRRDGETRDDDHDDTLVSSAPGMSPRPKTKTTGGFRLDQMRVTEELAREVLSRRFASYGAAIVPDYTLHEGNVLCTLDGYDPTLGVGYTYVSHSDVDVITDFDPDTEIALHNLAREGRCFVLVLHDSQVRSPEQLLIHTDEFLHSLPPADELRSRRS